MKIKILIVDDNFFIREGMKIILNIYEEFEVVDIVNDGEEVVVYCKKYEVDIVFLDVCMLNMNGVEVTKFICEEMKIKLFILMTFDDDEYILDVVKNGVKGYLLKNNDLECICDVIKGVYNG